MNFMRRLAQALSRPAIGFQGIARMLMAVRQVTGNRLWIALGLLVLGNLTEGATILLLLPILYIANNSGEGYAINLGEHQFLGMALPDITLGLGTLLTGLVLVVALQAVLSRYRSLYLAGLLADFGNSTRAGLFRAVAATRWDMLVRLRMSDLEHGLTGEIERIQSAGFLALSMLQAVVGMAVFFCISFAISLPMTLLAFGFGMVVILLLAPFRRMASGFGEKLMANRNEQYAIVSQFLSGLKTARSMNAEPVHIARFETNLERTKNDSLEYARRNGVGAGLFQVSTAMGAALFVYIALKVVQLDFSMMVVLLLILMRVSPRFQQLQGQMQQFLIDQPAWARVNSLRRDLEAEAEAPPASLAPLFKRPALAITLDHVEYRHPMAEVGTIAIKDCSLRIPVGKVTALIGASGSGKSTIADIIMGLIRPSSGTVRIDGHVLSDETVRSWREHLAYVPQETFLMNDTIRANMLAGISARHDVGTADDALLLKALDMAAGREFVMALPEGLDTQVGDRGVLLSGGERQRIALARAFLRRPSLLILDEATSALDWESQSKVADTLKRLAAGEAGANLSPANRPSRRITVLTIAHRPSMVAFADVVHAIADGRVIESGLRLELMANERTHLARMMASEVDPQAKPQVPLAG